MNAPNYYDAVRKFDRQILTAQIDKETADANIIASGNINIDLDKDLTNHYSKIKAGKNLTVNAGGTVENIGYQGIVHYLTVVMITITGSTRNTEECIFVVAGFMVLQ